ncbi:response regulator receiver protein : Response regulator receiver protein OS=uncultured bacterium GN=ACD_79C00896G0007 PE=4 SV=1: Response_reg [Gemmataceae bacterium]|nr:response regulator receiver protein : Response regulator receiver protein OS=uncultured bacterium GN=ACD_79C00896G0007 PE=4 SV=1: Response_reg [Gemmataceae bacterium]VTT97882.1 response regulator receiver protein : Response regulator receiver protein OS=uncultured bacterium GN=ACD_79C00896G0007 PE=4 SV=1: Response_reg [Gemmataceae bacterium]
MRILIADDEVVSRTILERTVKGWGHEVVSAADGTAAWAVLEGGDAPKLAVLDWVMPGLEGPEVCRRARALGRPVPTYTILLTSKNESRDVVAGFESGADDYVVKPFDRAELRSRIRVGERVVALQQGLAERVRELEETLARVRVLQGLIPVCAWCRRVRNDQNYWQSVEEYMAAITACKISHGICPACLDRECESHHDG